MQDSLGMCCLDRPRDLQRQRHCFFHAQGTGKRLAFDVLEHQVVWPYVVHLADMRMVQRRNSPTLHLETAAMVSLEPLDGNYAIKSCVSSLPHLSHAARTDGREESYGPSCVLGSQ